MWPSRGAFPFRRFLRCPGVFSSRAAACRAASTLLTATSGGDRLAAFPKMARVGALPSPASQGPRRLRAHGMINRFCQWRPRRSYLADAMQFLFSALGHESKRSRCRLRERAALDRRVGRAWATLRNPAAPRARLGSGRPPAPGTQAFRHWWRPCALPRPSTWRFSRPSASRCDRLCRGRETLARGEAKRPRVATALADLRSASVFGAASVPCPCLGARTRPVRCAGMPLRAALCAKGACRASGPSCRGPHAWGARQPDPRSPGGAVRKSIASVDGPARPCRLGTGRHAGDPRLSFCANPWFG